MRNAAVFLLAAALPLALPYVVPVPSFLMGNKKRTAYQLVKTYASEGLGSCESYVTGWQEWDGGLQFAVKYTNEGTSEVKDWVIEVELTQPVQTFNFYNGQVEKVSDDKYKLSPHAYSAAVPAGGQTNLQVHINYDRSLTPPTVKSLDLNGQKIVCMAANADNEAGEQSEEEQPSVPSVPSVPDVPPPEYPPTNNEEESQETMEQTEEDQAGQGQEEQDSSEEEGQSQEEESQSQEEGSQSQEEESQSQEEESQSQEDQSEEEEEEPAASPATTEARGVHVSWPRQVLGLYILLADNDEDGFENDSDSWTPELFPWQQEAANVLFFTFIHPETMDIPPSFKKLAATRGTDQPGAVPKDTVIIFAIGGYAYSLKPNPWWWLETKEAAEEMAERVAKWPEMYNCDGIDLDLEEGAGARAVAGPNMVHFIRKLRQLQPKMIVSQPTYGYPQVQAETDVINASWDTEGKSNNLADSIGLMVYEGTQSLNYVKNFETGTKQWEGFPINVNVPSESIILGVKGAASSSSINALCQASVNKNYRGIMVWYASVKNGFHYAISWDASIVDDSIAGYKSCFETFRPHNN